MRPDGSPCQLRHDVLLAWAKDERPRYADGDDRRPAPDHILALCQNYTFPDGTRMVRGEDLVAEAKIARWHDLAKLLMEHGERHKEAMKAL